MSNGINTTNEEYEGLPDLVNEFEPNLQNVNGTTCDSDQVISESIIPYGKSQEHQSIVNNENKEVEVTIPSQPNEENNVNIGESIIIQGAQSIVSSENKIMEGLTVRNDEHTEATINSLSKLNIEMKLVDSTKSANAMGTVVCNKMSDSLFSLRAYNPDDGSDDQKDSSSEDENSSVTNSLESPDMQFHDLHSDSEETSSSSDSDEDDFDSNDDTVEEGSPESKPEASQPAPQQNTASSWMADLDLDVGVVKIPDRSTLELSNKETFLHVGDVANILDRFVTVQGLQGVPVYDLETLLFLEEGQRVLGYISDVIGPVSAPIYVVKVEQSQNSLAAGSMIYSAPMSKYTKYVFVPDLMKARGSDASGVGDTEVPIDQQEFSDDEAERLKKSKEKSAKRKHTSQERHQEFETNMNRLNTLNTQRNNRRDFSAQNRQPMPTSRVRSRLQPNLSDFRCDSVPFGSGPEALLSRSQMVHWMTVNSQPPVHHIQPNYPGLPVPFDPSRPPPSYGSYSMNSAPFVSVESDNSSGTYVYGDYRHFWENNNPGPSNE